MYRRPKRRRKLIVGLVGVIACSAVLIKWWPGGDGVSPAEATPAAETASTAKNATSPESIRLSASDPAAGGGSKIAGSSIASLRGATAHQNAGTSGNTSAPKNPTPPPVSQNPPAQVNSPPVPATQPTLLAQASKPATEKPAPPIAVNNPPSSPTSAASQPATKPPPPKIESTPSGLRANQRVQAGFELIKQNKPVEARRMLTLALESPGISPADADAVRNELTKLNQRLVFSAEIVAGDVFAKPYVVESGDALSKIPKKMGLNTEYLFIKRINNIDNERRIRVGQRLKAITGPFHAVVDKRAFRMDLYLGDGDQRVFVDSFRVGLGEFDATPEGVFDVKANSKLINPAWANPRTGEQFAADDPKNPLGEYWIGLVGSSDNIRGLEGYGIHGTVEPDSIGQMKSMGCVRMLHDDVALVYELLMPGVSTVTIRGPDYP